MKTKLFALLLTLAMLVPTLAACGNGVPDETESDTADNPAGAQPLETQGDTEDIPDTLPLVVDGFSEYVIVRGENASPSEVTASTELQAYLQKITGALLPIVTDSAAPVVKEIVVGKTNREADGAFDRDELGTDGFVIKTDGGKLWLVGGEQRGTLYAVYTFLEDYLGCRFYTANFERVPETKTVSLKIAEDKQIPVFEVRNSFWADFYNHTLSAKRKLNCSRGRGVMAEEWGGSANWAGGQCHTLPGLAGTGTGGSGVEPCLSSEEVYNTVLTNFRAVLAANPTADYASISQGDTGIGTVCHCDACAASIAENGYSGHYLKFVNRIAEEIKDEYPDLMIHTFAYWFTVMPPKSDIVPADNVMIQFCTIEACFCHPLTECDQISGNSGDEYLPAGVTFHEILAGWSKICGYMSVWDYTTNFGNYNAPYGNFDVLRENMRLFADNNVKNVFEQGSYQSTNGEFSELRGYLLARLLWDPYMSEEEYYGYMDEFLADYYGPGWESIRAYIDFLCSYMAENFHLKIFSEVSRMFPVTTDETNKNRELPTFTAEQLKNYKDIDWTQYYGYLTVYRPSEVVTVGYEKFAEALEKAETDQQRTHIDKSSIQVDYLNSYFLYEFYNRQVRATLNKILNNALKLCVADGSLTQEESDAIKEGFKTDITDPLKQAYYDYNKALAEKMLRYGANHLDEHRNIAARGIDDLDLDRIPSGAGDW